MMENVLFKLFSEYSMDGRTLSKWILSARRFAELCKDSGLPSVKSSRSLNFSSFCDCIQKLAKVQFPEEFKSNSELAINSLIDEYLLPLLRHKSSKQNIIHMRDLNVPNSVIRITHSLHKAFLDIYTEEFAWEVRSSESIDVVYRKSFQHMSHLLTSFEIYPCILNKVKMHGIWRDVVVIPDKKFQQLITEAFIPRNQIDEGRAFTLSKFILVCYCCALYGYSQETEITLRFLNILYRIQMALKQQLKYKNLSLIPIEPIEDENENGNETKKQEITEDTEIVDTACMLSRAHGSQRIKLHEFLRILKNAGVVPQVGEPSNWQISQEQAKLIYVQAKPMTYSKFLRTLDTIPEVNEELRDMIENGLIEKSGEICSLENLKDIEVVKVIPMVSKIMLEMFLFYTGSEENMTFDQFMRFCREFEIFPDLMSNLKLRNIFEKIEGLSEDTQDEIFESQQIDFQRFIKALIVIAFETRKQGSVVEKVVYLFERMGTSSGPVAVYKSLGIIQSYQKQVFKQVEQIKARFAIRD